MKFGFIFNEILQESIFWVSSNSHTNFTILVDREKMKENTKWRKAGFCPHESRISIFLDILDIQNCIKLDREEQMYCVEQTINM